MYGWNSSAADSECKLAHNHADLLFSLLMLAAAAAAAAYYFYGPHSITKWVNRNQIHYRNQSLTVTSISLVILY